MVFSILLSDYNNAVNNKVGGKAANLAKLFNNNFNVPRGIVVTPDFQNQFFINNEIDTLIKEELNNLKCSDSIRKSTAANKVRKKIIESNFSLDELEVINQLYKILKIGKNKTFAVRSSCSFEDNDINSWAGQFDSFLNIENEDIPYYIKRCWASMFNVRAIQYNSEILLKNTVPPFAVIIQEMITGDYSGIAFSLDPLTGEKDRAVIEVVSGTADKAVSGEEKPYTVTISKEDGIILKRNFGNLGRVELLKPSQINELLDKLNKIEKLFLKPVDIEWTIKDSILYILQARPITQISYKEIKGEELLPDILDYQLVFKVRGLNFIFADLLCYGFGYLHPLFICDNNEFFQYFPNERMEYASRYGYNWLSKEKGFDDYKGEFINFHKKSLEEIKKILKEEITVNNVKTLFEIIFNYFIFYSKMDFQFTNLVYFYVSENRIISENLKKLSLFKDIARAWINELSVNEDCHLNSIIGKIAEKFSLDREEIQYYKIIEIYELFEDKKVENNILNQRKESSVVSTDGSKISYIYGKEASEYVKLIRELRHSQMTSKIVGQVANRGSERFVTGKIKLIHTDYEDIEAMENEINEMKQGDILVAKFTAPELIAACRKARAIITDQGGMLSHAAIISRELGIPCIVGTEYAIHSLNDKEEVKLDLNTGIVEKL